MYSITADRARKLMSDALVKQKVDALEVTMKIILKAAGSGKSSITFRLAGVGITEGHQQLFTQLRNLGFKLSSDPDLEYLSVYWDK